LISDFVYDTKNEQLAFIDGGLWTVALESKECLEINNDEINCIVFAEGFIYYGTFSGELIKHNGKKDLQRVQSHSCTIEGISHIKSNQTLLSYGSNCSIMIWDLELSQLKSYNLADMDMYSNKRLIRAECCKPGKFICLTDEGEMSEYNNGKAKILFKAHVAPIKCLSINHQSQNMVSIDGACNIILWNLKEKTTMASFACDIDATAVLYVKDTIVIGGHYGHIISYSIATLSKLVTIKGRGQNVSIMKHHIDKNLLAVGYESGVIDIRHISELTLLSSISVHTSRILAMDFSEDGRYMQTESVAFVKYIDITSKRALKYEEIKDVEWDSWSVLNCWQFQGIKGNVGAIDRTNKGVLACISDDAGNVSFYKFPPINSAPIKMQAFTTQVMNVAFCQQTQYLLLSENSTIGLFKYNSKLSEDQSKPYMESKILDTSHETKETTDEKDIKRIESFLKSGDQDIKNQIELANINLSCKTIIGYCYKIPLYFIDELNVAYASSNMVVIINIKELKTRFFNVHYGKITALCVHRTKSIAASSEEISTSYLHPRLYIWDLKTSRILQQFSKQLEDDVENVLH
jgi:WD40 repeat protein